MALKACKECGNQISTKAKICPNCGAPVKRQRRLGCLGIIIIVFVGLAILSSLRESDTSQTDKVTSSSKSAPASTSQDTIQQSQKSYFDTRLPLSSVVTKIPITEPNGHILTFERGIAQINIRVGPGMNYPADETGTLGENEILYVLEEKNGWIRFRVTREDNGWSAWIKKGLTASLTEIRQAREAKFGEPPVKDPWDGSVSCVKEYLKSAARDPDSLKYEQWSNVSYNENDGWLVMCVFRAKNGFGGYERDVKWFVIQHGRVVEVKNIDAYK